MRNVAIMGTGHSNYMFNSERPSAELMSETAMEAIIDSGLVPGDIQAFFMGNAWGAIEEGQSSLQSYVANEIGCYNIPATRLEGACSSGTMAVREGFIWVASGLYDIVLVGGVERATALPTPMATRAFITCADSLYEYPTGFVYPASFGMLAHLYSRTYNIPLSKLEDIMAGVSVQSHEYALLNPKAQIHKKLTKEDVLNSPMVASPLRLHNCCPFTDGSAAVVLASENVAKKLGRKPVYIAGVGQSSSGRISSQSDYYPRIRSREVSSQAAYRMAGITPKDIDICELHDCFSIASLIAAECLGLFEYGTAGEAWERGDTRIDGKIPINISGGLKAKGHPVGATGVGQVIEVTQQLRGELVGQGRQVEGAKYGITDTMGADGVVTNIILTTEK